MSLRPFVLATLLAAGLSQSPQATAPGKLRWVRGTVTAACASSLTLKLRDSTLTLAVDAETALALQAAALPAGSTIDVHFTDRSGDRRAALLLPAPSGELSKRPGHSYYGTVNRTRWGSLSLRVEGRNRSVSLEKKTTLFAADGTALGSGSKQVSEQLKAGETVLVTYDEVSSDIPAGEFSIPSTTQRALEIRRLIGSGSTP